MSEMIERVAKELFFQTHGDGWDGPLLSDRGREFFRKTARAAIEAMREPTEGMLKAEASYENDKIWRGLIDAALATEPAE